MTTATSCCARRPSEYPHARVADIPEIAQILVDVTPPGAVHRSYRCRPCGQAWEEYRIPLAEPPDDFRVLKVGGASDAPDASGEIAVQPLAARPAGANRKPGARAFAILALGACLFYALWLLPPLATGKAWVARWIVGGLLAVLAVQSFLSFLRSRKPSPRG